MSDLASARERFIATLNALSENDAGAPEQTEALRRALLEYASETPDNVSCAQGIEIGSDGNGLGLRLVGSNIPLSDIAHELEDVLLPAPLSSAFPELTERDWDTFTRLTTLIYTALGRRQEQR